MWLMMALLFRSKSCKLPTPSTVSMSSDWEEDETEDEMEEYIYNPISTPFINKHQSSTDRSSDGNPSTPFLAFLVAALRKSIVTCTTTVDVETDEELCALDIGCPTNVRHLSHVTFDRFHGFLGLPPEFHPQLPRRVPSASVSVFGVSPQSMQCSIDERGKSVPTIVIMMQKRLYEGGGLEAEGIFRINAENSLEQFVRNQLNKGVVPKGIDVHCLAGLIKTWFRELPKGVLDSLTADQVMHCNTEDQCTRLVNLLPPTEAALLDWAINLMADVVQNEQLNKMNTRNIAMVFAPNMTQMADPLTALIHAVQVMNFLKTLIERTIQLREESAADASRLSSYAVSINASNNTQPSVPIGDLFYGENRHTCAEQTHNTKLLRSITLDRLEFSPGQKHQMFHMKYGDEGKEQTNFSGGGSSISSLASESKHESREVEGILDGLNFGKGVKKLCRHPVFQLYKPAKKSGELEIVNSR